MFLASAAAAVSMLPCMANHARSPQSVSPEEAVRIVRQEAASRFRIKDDKFDMPLVGSLRFAPAEVIEFIEDLETDFGFRPAGKVSPTTASVNDLISAFTSQK